MSILQFNGFPEEYKGYELSTDFRNMINAELLMNDDTLRPFVRNSLMLRQLYPVIPDNIELAEEGLLWFYSRGKSENDSKSFKRRSERSYDFEQDADYIYASFVAAYGIRLAEIDYMHWWEFMTLLSALPDDTIMGKVMYYRTCDISKLDKYEKPRVLEMRKHFALKKPERESLETMTIDELNRKTMEYYDKRAKGGG